MAIALIVTGAILTAHYAFVIGLFSRGFSRIRESFDPDPVPDESLASVSVLIPARNEAENLPRCLDAVLRSDYPEELLEVIVVDDASTDGTSDVVRRFQERRQLALAGTEQAGQPRGSVLQLVRTREDQRQRAHKKAALELGIQSARGEIILTTDADCIVRPEWIRTMVSTFDVHTAFVSGPVRFTYEDSFFSRVQALEFAGLVAVGAGAIGAGRPNMCNGANVAYRRNVFLEVGGFRGIDHLTSGDDELLMQKIAYETAWKVRFCPDPRAIVETRPAPDLRSFFHQRKRWASKGLHYPHTPLVLMLVGIYLFYLMLLASPFIAILAPGLAPVLVAAWLVKLGVEASLLFPACRHFGCAGILRYFFPAQLLHVPYVVFFPIAGAVGGYEWKNRSIAR